MVAAIFMKYKGIKINGKKIDKHRWIMEQHLGRKLKRNEVVHHKKENGGDILKNLEVKSLSEHSRYHQKKNPHKHCELCGRLLNYNEKCTNNKCFPRMKEGLFRCSKCKRYLEYNHFHKSISKKYGINSDCIFCESKRKR